MTRTALAIAADYADAMMVARRAKNWLFLVLLLVLLIQLALFFVARMRAGFIWCGRLPVLLFPRRALRTRSGHPNVPDFKVPGGRCSWPGLRDSYGFRERMNAGTVRNWARCVGCPVVSLILLLGA